jgi:hypothetical protein
MREREKLQGKNIGSALNYFATLYNCVDVVSLSLMFTAIMRW